MALFRIKYPILAMDDWLLRAAAAAAAELSEKLFQLRNIFIKGFGK
jgi:hypothetical protein